MNTAIQPDVQEPLATLANDVADLRGWLRNFEAGHGRPLRVLHVGNVANNAFLNAKFLRGVGVEAHVLSYGTRHAMATPEWEEIEVRDHHGDDFLPVFGSTAPQSLAAETPVIGSYVPEETKWLIQEPAPILSAFSPEEVADAVCQALDPAWRADFQRRARHWIDTYHSPDVVVRDHLSAYRRVIEATDEA